MSGDTLICPNCGAGVKFAFKGSVQSVCVYCGSILVRKDMDLTKVGEVSAWPDDSSPIQLGTEGVYKNMGFYVAGRIMYEYDNGGWNEWHIVFNDGSSGWLSDAQLDYAVSTQFPGAGKLPLPGNVQISQRFKWGDSTYEVTSITQANYRGVEGELPFEYWDKERCTFADLRSATGRFATIDYSEEQPLVFVGESVSFADLKLKNVRQFEGWN